jgi:hypothetical protein
MDHKEIDVRTRLRIGIIGTEPADSISHKVRYLDMLPIK